MRTKLSLRQSASKLELAIAGQLIGAKIRKYLAVGAVILAVRALQFLRDRRCVAAQSGAAERLQSDSRGRLPRCNTWPAYFFRHAPSRKKSMLELVLHFNEIENYHFFK